MENKPTKSGLFPTNFVKVVDGKPTSLSVLENSAGCEVTLLNYGARIVSLMVPDKSGKMIDVVTGHKTIDEYIDKEYYFGATCGRYSNRIAKGRFEIDGIVYDKLAINNASNFLHGGIKGFNCAVWDVKQIDESTVEMKYLSKDGEEGFPGNLESVVTFHLSPSNELIITYKATTDKATVVNLTNHTYFNLSGEDDQSIGDHLLTIDADHFLPTDVEWIPFGDPAKVEGTPFDFRTPVAVGKRIDDTSSEQIKFGKGYDHTYILNKKIDEMGFCSKLESPKTGIVMETFTTEPGVQLYSGNWLVGDTCGKAGKIYPRRTALCLETQHYPDSPNQPSYPSTVLRPGHVMNSKTIYKFSVASN